ncbi:MAG: glycosyltransferase family 2 protein [Moorea sp. SIO2I5]|nr:glycosyltransferase family 2 protein [Moorena sp. SIO2I5]
MNENCQLLVSIVINNYNYGQFLPQAIDSSLSQTYPNTEVIVVDDESTDNSQEIITSYGDKIIPILKKNGGQASALNAGFYVSRGEIVIFLDADDYLFPNAVSEVVAVWKPGVVQVQYRLELVNALSEFIGIFPAPDIKFDSGTVWPILLEKGNYSGTVTSGNSFARSALAQIFPIPESDFTIAADGYLVTLNPFYGQVVSIEKPLGAYRQHGNNLWAFSKGTIPIERFRRSINHDFIKYNYLVRKATELGYHLCPDLHFRDPNHLIHRIASLRLDPHHHPFASDSPLVLAYKGYWSIWKYSKFNWKKKLLWSHWLLWVGIMPYSMVKPVISWPLSSASRPKIILWLVKLIRQVIRILTYKQSLY